MSESSGQTPRFLSWIGRSAANKVLTAILVVGVGAALIWWFQLPPDQRETAIQSVKMVLLWLIIVGVLPWGLFFIPPLIVRTESNAASALMLGAYVIVDGLVALGFMDWDLSDRLRWGGLLFGLLLAAVYNFMVCEFLASRAED